MIYLIHKTTLVGLAAVLLTAVNASAQEAAPAVRPGVTRPAEGTQPMPAAPAQPNSSAPS